MTISHWEDALGGRTPTCAAHTCPVGRAGCYGIERLDGGRGAGRRPSSRRRLLANRLLRAATSASWRVTDPAWLTTFAPIFTSLSRSAVSDQCSTSFGNARVRLRCGGRLPPPASQCAKVRLLLRSGLSLLTATPRLPGDLAGTTVLPPKSDFRAAASALRPVLFASPPCVDLPGGPAVPLLSPRLGPWHCCRSSSTGR